MYIFAFEVLNLYSIDSPSHIGQTALNRTLTILIFVPILSFFPPIFHKHFGSEVDRVKLAVKVMFRMNVTPYCQGGVID